MTKYERNAKSSIPQYDRSTDTCLEDCYKSCSVYKHRAWAYCEEQMHKRGGWGLKVISHNTGIFTAGFLFEDKETGVVKFMYITPSYDAIVDY